MIVRRKTAHSSAGIFRPFGNMSSGTWWHTAGGRRATKPMYHFPVVAQKTVNQLTTRSKFTEVIQNTRAEFTRYGLSFQRGKRGFFPLRKPTFNIVCCFRICVQGKPAPCRLHLLYFHFMWILRTHIGLTIKIIVLASWNFNCPFKPCQERYIEQYSTSNGSGQSTQYLLICITSLTAHASVVG